MKRPFLISFLPILLLSCDVPSGGGTEGISGLSLPASTSLGKLVRIERKTEGSLEVPDPDSPAQTSLSPTPQEVLYVLYFEGRDKIEYRGTPDNDGIEAIRLVDSAKSYSPSHYGVWTDRGAIVDDQIKFNGAMTGRDGKWVFAGTMELGTPRVALVFRVPRNASNLTLWDGGQRVAS